LKILAVSDMVVDVLYSPRVAEYLHGIDLVLGCGDLPFEYLEFLISALNVPLYYVPGNHDPAYNEANPAARVDGGTNLDCRIVCHKGLNIAGIGGSIRYKPGHANQYEQKQMRRRLTSFTPALAWHLLRHGSVLDILITHSPPLGIHDDDDPAHVGFSSFHDLIRLARPRYFLHGHKAKIRSNLEAGITQVATTTIINIYPYRILEVSAACSTISPSG
jgi:Icc-related predicted phosphoesterase